MAQKVLGLNHPESEQLEQAVAAAMKTAIQNLTDEVLADLSEGAAPADRDLASFLMQRQLREE